MFVATERRSSGKGCGCLESVKDFVLPTGSYHILRG
jgi:hypothetical protein